MLTDYGTKRKGFLDDWAALAPGASPEDRLAVAGGYVNWRDMQTGRAGGTTYDTMRLRAAAATQEIEQAQSAADIAAAGSSLLEGLAGAPARASILSREKQKRKSGYKRTKTGFQSPGKTLGAASLLGG